MEKIPASKFKVTCLAVIRKVSRTRKPVCVTKFGKPIVDIVPSVPEETGKSWLGSMRGTLKIHGDIVGPVADESDWEALQD